MDLNNDKLQGENKRECIRNELNINRYWKKGNKYWIFHDKLWSQFQFVKQPRIMILSLPLHYALQQFSTNNHSYKGEIKITTGFFIFRQAPTPIRRYQRSIREEGMITGGDIGLNISRFIHNYGNVRKTLSNLREHLRRDDMSFWRSPIPNGTNKEKNRSDCVEWERGGDWKGEEEEDMACREVTGGWSENDTLVSIWAISAYIKSREEAEKLATATRSSYRKQGGKREL